MSGRFSARMKIRRFLESNLGKVVTTEEIAQAAGIREYARRIRELRDDEGMQIQSCKDRRDLKPNQYILVSLERAPRFTHKIDKTTRARILERNGMTCAMCGIGAGDPDPYKVGRTIRLQVDHVNPDGPTTDENLRVLCSNCNEGRSNIAIPPTPNTLTVLRTIRRLPRDQQRRLFDELKMKFDPHG
jgi:5-methylcytosine-specific restriction endonuclease McrA